MKHLPPDNKFFVISAVIVMIILAYVLGYSQSTNFFGIFEEDIKEGNLVDAEVPGCSRTERYDNLPEFERVLSLINQRYTQLVNINHPLDETERAVLRIIPCVEIIYTESKATTGAEGYFIFDTENYRKDHLPIYVDNSYSQSDDVLTSILLVHELTHASQFIEESQGKLRLSCMDKENYAFTNQFNYVTFRLNPEELRSIITRAGYLHDHPDADVHPQIGSVKTFFDFFLESGRYCGQDVGCQLTRTSQHISNWIYENPFYEEQCREN